MVTFLLIFILNAKGAVGLGTSQMESPDKCQRAAAEFAEAYQAAHPGEWFQVGCLSVKAPAKA